jgi:small subunit ribosomal protein S13
LVKEKAKKAEDKPKVVEAEELKHIVRILNSDLEGKRQVQMALTGINGVGRRAALIFASKAGVSPHAILGKLSDAQIDALKRVIEQEATEVLPAWMVNKRGDISTGENKHIMGIGLAMSVMEDIDLMKKMRGYKGIRHERGLRVRGQRTRSTGRTGAIVGVSRKREGAPAATAKKEE